MKRTKIISSLLSLSMLAALVVSGTLALSVHAAEETGEGMEISKTAIDNGDGTYTITLEAYATGERFSTEVTKDVPADIVLVLDQSGSMDEEMYTYDFQAYRNKSNRDYYTLRHNGGRYPNLYYKLDNGSYVTVSVERSQNITYTACPANWPNSANRGDENYYSNQNNLYIKEGGEYKKVVLERSGGWLTGYTFTYIFPDGSIIVSERNNTVPDFEGKGPLYVRSIMQGDDYTYFYTDSDGVRQVIGTSSGQSTRPTDFILYERYLSGSVTRLEALKTAVEGFANSVSEKAKGEDGQLHTEDDVNHRIAVVGYASRYDSNNEWKNTELFIGSTQHNYSVNAENYYDSAFQNMSTDIGVRNVNDSIDALDADGATYTNYGLEMANGILNANPVNEGEKRSRVIVLFTDGYPGKNADDFNLQAATAALTQATIAKNNGVSVYSVGIFNGADATTAGNMNGDNTDAANWFMQNVSSNNGTPQNPSYYLSASDADTLNNIFQQISDNIESGGSATTLGGETVIRDVVSDYFQLPTGTDVNDITVQTVPCTGITNDVPTWGTPEEFTDAEVTVDVDAGIVNVSGFDFAGNYVGMDTLNGEETLHNPAKKLVISFKVEPRTGFLGGNGVPTNDGAYIYENEDAAAPVLEFKKPDVDVPINTINVTAKDKNVYLLGELTAAQLKSGATAEVGDVELELGETNYGLKTWQNEYVNIKVVYQDKDGNEVTGLNNLKDDTTYTVSVKITPKKSGIATEQNGKGSGNINVFKPELTFRDSEVYYGDTVPTDFIANKVSEIWKHGNMTSTDQGVDMTGDVPVLNIAYTPDSTKIQDDKINTKQDVPVKVDVEIGTEDVQQYTTFVHQDCSPACGWTETTLDGDPAFLLHVKTCQLTISKQNGENGEPYVFTVERDGRPYTSVTVVGNNSVTLKELPIGTYSIKEDGDWSWRYTPEYDKESVTLNEERAEDSITCINTDREDPWLNDYSPVIKNIYGEEQTVVNE